MAEDKITVTRPGDRRVPSVQTSGMVREEAFSGGQTWVGYVRSAPRTPSGWHHHGDHESFIYVIEGRLRFEFGVDGSMTVNAGPGDFVRVPPRVVHREDNPGDVEGRFVVVRVGSGEVTVNVQGPVASTK